MLSSLLITVAQPCTPWLKPACPTLPPAPGPLTPSSTGVSCACTTQVVSAGGGSNITGHVHEGVLPKLCLCITCWHTPSFKLMESTVKIMSMQPISSSNCLPPRCSKSTRNSNFNLAFGDRKHRFLDIGLVGHGDTKSFTGADCPHMITLLLWTNCLRHLDARE